MLDRIVNLLKADFKFQGPGSFFFFFSFSFFSSYLANPTT